MLNRSLNSAALTSLKSGAAATAVITQSGGTRTAALVPRRLDDIDTRILVELQRDGRITFQRLSELVGLSPRPCLERVRRLERERLIIGYTTRVDIRRLVNAVIVLMRVVVKQGREIRCRFEQRIRNSSEVLECFEVSGTFDYMVKVACPTLTAYQELTDAWIDDPSLNVERIESNIVLRSAKDSGIYPVQIAQATSKEARSERNDGAVSGNIMSYR